MLRGRFSRGCGTRAHVGTRCRVRGGNFCSLGQDGGGSGRLPECVGCGFRDSKRSRAKTKLGSVVAGGVGRFRGVMGGGVSTLSGLVGNDGSKLRGREIVRVLQSLG